MNNINVLEDNNSLSKDQLRSLVQYSLEEQGYIVSGNSFKLPGDERAIKRSVQSIAKVERILKNKDFILNNIPLIKKTMINGDNLDVSNIYPRLIEIEAGTSWEKIFRWWNLAWWSLPYERAYGRQMRFLVWDDYHNAPIGLIGLQSPILSWKVRDDYLNIPYEQSDYWVNQSLSAQRLGALPPYNQILGGKLVASLVTANVIKDTFNRKYEGRKTEIKKRELPARLLFITTTGAFGKSSIYNRLKYNKDSIAIFIGYSQGSGSFHIPNYLFDEIIKFLKSENINTARGYGTGPSRKLRLIDTALGLLGFSNGAQHGINRAVYLFPLVNNLIDVINSDASPIWYERTVEELTAFWKERWAIKRANENVSYREYNSETFLLDTVEQMKNMENNVKGIYYGSNICDVK